MFDCYPGSLPANPFWRQQQLLEFQSWLEQLLFFFVLFDTSCTLYPLGKLIDSLSPWNLKTPSLRRMRNVSERKSKSSVLTWCTIKQALERYTLSNLFAGFLVLLRWAVFFFYFLASSTCTVMNTFLPTFGSITPPLLQQKSVCYSGHHQLFGHEASTAQ